MTLPTPDTTSSLVRADALAASALAVQGGRAVLLSADGEVAEASAARIEAALAGQGLIACHAPFTFKRMGLRAPPRQHGLFDLAELYAFVHPATFAPPTPFGLAGALGLAAGQAAEDQALLLFSLRDRLLADLRALEEGRRAFARETAGYMAKGSWPWAALVGEALGPAPAGTKPAPFLPWRLIPEWEERPKRPPPGDAPVSEAAARARLDGLLTSAVEADEREARPEQSDYAALAARAFAVPSAPETPSMVALEAGTGIGKTLGYLAPALAWAEQNDGVVWVSTYTKNLQRQISQTAARLIPDEAERQRRVVIRKGRENYLCLLNFQEAVGGGLDAIGLGLVARWLSRTADGDMIGGDFPTWLVPLISTRRTDRGGAQRLGLTDRRGECIFGACQHYRRCFIETAERRADGANLIIANHAKVLAHATSDRSVPEHLRQAAPERLVLDEGHHLFDAADSSFAIHLTATEMAELRRWIRGNELGARARRGRGLTERLSELIGDDDACAEALRVAAREAAGLPGADWPRLLGEDTGLAGLDFLAAVRTEVLARASEPRDPYGAECEVHPLSERLAAAGERLDQQFGRIETALKTLEKRLAERFEEAVEADALEALQRLDGALRAVMLRTRSILPAWRGVLESLAEGPTSDFIDWLAIERSAGHDTDIGYYRHHLDPTRPLAEQVYQPAKGVLVTSATLFSARDGAEENEGADRLGLGHLDAAPLVARFASPFDYREQTRFLVVRDVDTRAADPLALAYRVLIEAAGGGTLALFAAIERLKAVHKRIAHPLEAAGLPVYAQHVDEMDIGTLVDIFRSETNASLLGTDAARDGVDVPGRSLRLIVMDRIPWPRPDILHRHRRAALAGRAYEDDITRARISQAFGRLIRRRDDKGVFVLLGAQAPSRLFSGLPAGVEVTRTGLADATRIVHDFVGSP